ncbi:aminoglycoside 6-adenylyltransferase [Shouchella patagoniensis]|uniref:aminoglycoside 6-adenylyltransferase n=1 Tax=Shouchella patagoniensis TaxID=228576 RepID=UPI0009958326|nr:aminoglycoside 6-adenylyltransferase [Shouchella patagoniensis]
MRTEKEMMALILEVAKQDKRVRAVGLNGSRTNPNAKKDPFQDYDVVFVVKDMDPFIKNEHWIDVFGERMIMQTPEDMDLFPPSLGGRFSYLMLFKDGNRIDLTLVPIEERDQWNGGERLAVVLLDKDGDLPKLPQPTDQDYWAKQPTYALFSDCCNEFWWVATYVAKGLWRGELIYAIDHLSIMRTMLLQMLEWQVGEKTNYKVSIGKSGKYLERYIRKEDWEKLVETYSKLDKKGIWSAFFVATDLFDDIAISVAKILELEYPFPYVNKVRAYIEHVCKLPQEAKEIY